MIKSANTNTPLALALETSGRIGSVAVGCDGKLSDERIFSAPLRHSAELFDTIIELIDKSNKKANQIGYVCISIGPGSFTGIRISVTAAKMMALAAQSKILAVSTTDAMALNVEDKKIKKIATIIDAKRGQFFIAVFERKDGTWKKILADCLLTAEQFKEKFDLPNEPIWLLGEGLLYYAKKFETDNIKILNEKFWSPRASNIFKIGVQMAEEGKFSDPLTVVPFYLRRPEAEENWEKKQTKSTGS
ncbi:MAG: tRNA (adenosine(37)-N6)-threonylcarbamoyltransferase complex dimerization subunit type 1 TsaB [Sedimentisphaerales bacterium]|nr:tRNA (adenosine(37)-N6)-threonylcarbamoyltransferase complex dimerization subunit type 1 TsaB [Sedimentisphaerales bacterium]